MTVVLLALAVAMVRHFIWRRSLTMLPGARSLAFSPDGTRLAVLDPAGRIVVRSVPDGGVVGSVQGIPELDGPLRYSDDGGCIASLSARLLDEPHSSGVMLVDVRAWTARHIPLASPVALAFSGDSKRLFVGTADGSVLVLPTHGRGSPRELLKATGHSVNILAACPTDDLLLVSWCSDDQADLTFLSAVGNSAREPTALAPYDGFPANLTVVSTADGSTRRTINSPLHNGLPAEVSAASFSQDATTVAAVYDHGLMVRWEDGAHAQCMCQLGSGQATRFSRTGDWLAVTHVSSGFNDFGRNTSLSLWDVRQCRRVAAVHLGLSQVYVSSVSADGRYVAAAGYLGWPIGHGNGTVLWRARR